MWGAKPRWAALTLAFALGAVGCVASGGDGPEAIDPRAVQQLHATLEALEPVAVEHADLLYTHHVADGIVFVANTPVGSASPRYASDADNAIFTGLALAAAAYRYGVTGEAVDLAAVDTLLDGIHRLAHAHGIPGVLARSSFAREGAWARFGYGPDRTTPADNQWRKRIAKGQVYERDGWVWYTKATRDQLTGVLFGLAVTHVVVDEPPIRERVREITAALARRLRESDGSLVDHEGRTGTNAHRIDAPLELALAALEHATTNASSAPPTSAFFQQVGLRTAYYNRWLMRTFVFHLHLMNAHTLLLLRDHHAEHAEVRRWHDKLWSFVTADENPQFAALHHAATGAPPSADSLGHLERRSRENYRGFFAWEKDPEAWWDDTRTVRGPGIDVLLPYWMLRYAVAESEANTGK